jgi:hypothetical protein
MASARQGDLGRIEVAHLLVLDLGQRHPPAWRLRQHPAVEGGRHRLGEQLVRLVHRRRGRPRPVSDVIQARTSRWVLASSGTAPNLGSTYSRNTISLRVRVLAAG